MFQYKNKMGLRDIYIALIYGFLLEKESVEKATGADKYIGKSN